MSSYLLEVELARPSRTAKGTLLRVRIGTIKERIAATYKIDVARLERSNRRDPITQVARQVGMYLSYEMTELSLSQIALAFGVRDHGTVVYARTRIEERMSRDPKYREAIEELVVEIHSHTPA